MDNLEHCRLVDAYFEPNESEQHLKLIKKRFIEIDEDWKKYVPHGIVDLWDDLSFQDREAVSVMAIAIQCESGR